MRDPEPLADVPTPSARIPEPPAPSTQLPIRPIIIHKPIERIIERTYTEGYREVIHDPPGRNTEPIIVMQPIARQEPEKTYIVMQPPIQERRTYEPRPPERYPEEERDDPKPIARPHTPPIAPIRSSPVVESNQPENLEVKPFQKEISPDTQSKKLMPVDNKKINAPVKEKINEPLKFSPSEAAPDAQPRKKLQHKKRNPGRQRKYHQTISLLEEYASGDTNQFDRLDPQMQRYYRREYVEYFGRESKRSAEQRLANRTKAARTKRESERRRIAEISRNHADTAV